MHASVQMCCSASAPPPYKPLLQRQRQPKSQAQPGEKGTLNQDKEARPPDQHPDATVTYMVALCHWGSVQNHVTASPVTEHVCRVS